MTVDLERIKRAFEGKDAAAWAELYADDAEWIEYSDATPPRAPRRLVGKAAITAKLKGVCGADLAIKVSDAIAGDSIASFRVWVTFPNGDRIIEQVLVEHLDGKITKQVDVEAWDAV